MARSSPAVKRIVSILNFFAEHPQEAFTLTQIVKSLRMNPSTCFTILGGLVEGGYLYRNPDKSYLLGPAALALSNSAKQHFSPLDVARQEMRALADEIDVVIAALFLERDELVVRERAAALVHLGMLPPPGQRYPVFPWGIAFMAQRPGVEVEAWMNKATPSLSESRRQVVYGQIEFLRRHGYALAVHQSNRITPPQVGVEGADPTTGPILTDLDPAQDYYLQFMAAPVMNGEGKVAFILAFHGFTRPFSATEVAGMGARLCEACGRISGFITGKPAPAIS